MQPRPNAGPQSWAHRPWPPPRAPWIMAQSWRDLLFAHWPIPESELRRVVPASLPIDTFGGQAWIGVVPFRMTGVRMRWMPDLPGVSAFPELNVRTYTTLDGKPGVYFFSLDAASRVAVMTARRWFQLPYFFARMSSVRRDETITYESRRVEGAAPSRSHLWETAGGGWLPRPPWWPSAGAPGLSYADFSARYRPSGEVFRAEPGSLAHWLTERYCLYTADGRGGVRRAEILHPPWPLQPAEADITRNTMVAPIGLELPDLPPVLHFSRRLDVVVWPPQKVRM